MSTTRIRWRMWIWATVLLAFGLRVLYLGSRGLWYDEAYSILFAARSTAEIMAGTLTQVRGATAEVHPPSYYLALHGWLGLAGTSTFAARYLSVAFGVATVPVVYRMVRHLFGHFTAFLAATIVAVAPFHVAYSQEVRMYAPLTFWSTLALYGLVSYRSNGRIRWLAVLVGAGACALYTQNLGFLVFAALSLWTMVDAVRRRDPRLLRATVVAGVAMGILWLPWLLIVPSQMGVIERSFWVPPPTITTLVQTVLVLTFGFDNAAPPAGLLAPLLLVSVLVVALTGFEVVKSLWAARRGRERESAGLAAALAGLPVVILLVVSTWRPVYTNRALLPAFVWYAILVAWALRRMPRVVGIGLAVGLALLVATVYPTYYSYATFPRSPFQAVAAALAPRLEPGDVILHDNKLSFFPMYYYDPTLPDEFLADPLGAGSDTLLEPTQKALGLYATDFDHATKNATRIWFVIFQDAIDQAQAQGKPHANLAWMEQHFQRVSLDRYNDLNVYLYSR